MHRTPSGVAPGRSLSNSKPPRAGEPGPPPAAARTTADPIIFSIRGTRQWREWLKQFAEHQRITPTALIDQVLAEAARRGGFTGPPPRRGNAGLRDDTP